MNALLITSPTNIRYLTGFVGALPDEREAFVLLTDTITYLFTNVLYLEEARGLRITDSELRVVEISRENPLSTELKKILDEGTITTLAVEEDNLTVAELKKLKKELKGITLKATLGKISDMRLIKQGDEIENIRKACALTDACFTYILPFLKAGVTEKDITWEMETFIRKNGGQLAFTPIVAFGVNTSKPHYSGTGDKGQEARLQENDIVLLDFGAKVNGYCADMTRVVFIGQPKDEWQKAYEVTRASQQNALDLLSHGIRSGAALDDAAKKIISDAGLPPYPHSLGHGVGLDIHEAPRLSVKRDAELKTGMTVTVEPGIYIEGQFGIRIEDTVAITSNSVEVLTRARKDIIIL